MFNIFIMNITDTAYYIISGVLVLFVFLGISLMSKAKTARIGNGISMLAVMFAVIVTIIKHKIIPIWAIYPAMAIGIIIGLIWAKRVKMIEMPQLVAIFNGIGGAASAIVASMAFMGIGSGDDIFSKITSLLAVAIGMITFLGSFVAAGKLHKVLTQKPIVLPKHQLISFILLILTATTIVLGATTNILSPSLFLIIILSLSSIFGIFFSIQIGGADMPITISLLNSFSGVSGAIAGLAINDVLLVAIGGIVGASGLILTRIMCKAMNRSLFAILLGKTTTSAKNEDEEVMTGEGLVESDPVAILLAAKKVIIVPGYGMAVAQSQHLVKQLADKLSARDIDVKFAIHPVAGRMPGHMNVLLSEANVDYEDLYEMEAINDEFKEADVAIVIGANDVLNPAARTAKDTPIYGMPILNVDMAKHIMIFNYDLKPGYSGVNNPIYNRKENLNLILGNAAETLDEFLKKLD